MTRKCDDMKQNRAKAEMVAECVRLNGAGEKIATSTGNGVDDLFTRMVTWVDKKSLRTSEECFAFMLLNNITEEGITRFQSPPASPLDIEEAKTAATTMWDSMNGNQLKAVLTHLKEANEYVKDNGYAKQYFLNRLTIWSARKILHTTGDVDYFRQICNISD